jgi:two-component system phosphate regulon sensor histidine kinase PhoR
MSRYKQAPMREDRPLPWTGIGIAVFGGIGMLVAGVDVWLCLAILLVWIASLWISLPPPPQPVKSNPDSMQITRGGMRELIEHSGMPLLVLDESRVIMANNAARDILGRHVIGQDAKVAFRHPAAVELLNRRKGGSATIQGLTGPRSIWQMSRHQVDNRYDMIELVNRTAEADISRAHTDFVANASHELRTPLASIIGYMETLSDEDGELDSETRVRFYDTVLREAKRLQTLVSDLLSLSRVEAEKHDQPSEKVELGPLVRQAAKDAAGPDRGVRVQCKIDKEPIWMRADRQQMEQLVRNLVDNALKYGDPDLPVTVRLERDEQDLAVLTVEDRGEGIDAEHLPHLTRRFYRTDPGRSRAAGGTGLGLAIVKHIVERHRGRLDISSKRGQGTTVAAKFPTLSEAPE